MAQRSYHGIMPGLPMRFTSSDGIQWYRDYGIVLSVDTAEKSVVFQSLRDMQGYYVPFDDKGMFIPDGSPFDTPEVVQYEDLKGYLERVGDKLDQSKAHPLTKVAIAQALAIP